MRIIFFTLFFLITIASATSLSCLHQSPEERINASDIIFTGTVTDIDRPLFHRHSSETIDITFQVRDVYKGSVTEKITITQHCWIGCDDLEGDYLILGSSLGMCDYPIPIGGAEEYLDMLPQPGEPIEQEGGLERILDWIIFWR